MTLRALDYSWSPNIVEGKELWRPSAVAVDASVTPPALYVSDSLNNRVLGWTSATGFAAGDPANVVIGQRDFVTTRAQGPSTSLTRGLNTPTGIAADSQGNLYVVDSGNNRILRYPRPFADSANGTNPDLLIGQADYSSNRANRGATVTADGVNPILAVTTGSDTHSTAQQLTFDGSGNLWYTDTGNHRVLRYPKMADGKVQTSADIVLGQANMTSASALAYSTAGALDKTGLRYPVGVAFDQAGRIFVSDGLSRVLVYSNPAAAGNTALRLLGILRTTQTLPNDTQFGFPMGLAAIGNNLVVTDPTYNRILAFDPYDSWPADSPTASSPPAKYLVGQTSFSAKKPSAARQGLRSSLGVFVAGNELYVADSGNNRVVVYPPGLLSSALGTAAAERVLAQRDFGYSGANMVDGRGLYLFSTLYTISGVTGATFTDGGGVAVDTTSNPPRLYISDAYNHRVLGYKDARNVRTGDAADIVIGQPDLLSASPNGTLGDETLRNDTTLYTPAGVAVDANGNLYVADRGNARVLRFPQPFAQPAGATQRANLVLGQRNFTDKNTDVSDVNMASPYGVALMPEGYLLVSDSVHSRVLVYRKAAGADFTSGMPASTVLGQPDFFTSTAVLGAAERMAFPRGISSDSSGRLYVADTGNNRLMVFSQVGSITPTLSMLITNSAAATTLRSPVGVAIDPQLGSIWVAELLGNNAGRVLRYPEFFQLQTMPVPLPDSSFAITPGSDTTAGPPVALAMDGSSNLIVAEWNNRVSFYFPPLWATSAANYLPRVDLAGTQPPCCAPGSIATLWPFSPSGLFGKAGDVTTTDFGSLPNPVPLPKTLGDVQVLLSSTDYPETPAPLYLVSAGQINFQIPKNAPMSGTVDITVVRPSTGQVLSASPVAIRPNSPGLFTQPTFPTSAPTGAPVGITPIQVAAQNGDDAATNPTCNGQQGPPLLPSCPGGVRPVKRGEVIVLYGTGPGVVPEMPDDGATASGQATPATPRVLIGPSDAEVVYSGLAPTLIGVWQINAKVPATAPPGAARVVVFYNDTASSAGTTPYTVIQVQ